jgi:hypothetical protein
LIWQEKQQEQEINMKQFLVFIKKEWLHIWRDKRTLFILFGMPITQIILFGFALSNEVKNSKIAILYFPAQSEPLWCKPLVMILF